MYIRRIGMSIVLVAATVPVCLTQLAATPATGAPANPIDKPIVHQVPSVPVTIDGKRVAAATVTQYNGRPLYSAALPENGPNGSVAIFTEPAEFEKFVSSHGGPAHALAKPKELTPDMIVAHGPSTAADRPAIGSMAASGHTFIYEDGEFWGNWLSMPSGYGATDLTQWDMSCTLWFCTNWNDETSSVWADNYRGQTVYEHTNWTGSALWTPGGSSRAYLSLIGWNDRVSSFGSHP